MGKEKVTRSPEIVPSIITIPGYLPDDLELKKKLHNGLNTYHHPNNLDSEIYVYEEQFLDTIHSILDKFRILVDLLGDDAYSDFGCLFSPYIRLAQNEVEEVNDLLFKHIGSITVRRISRGNGEFYRVGRLVDMKLVLKEAKGGCCMIHEDNIETKDFSNDLPRIYDTLLALETLIKDSNQGKTHENRVNWGIACIISDAVSDLWTINEALYPGSEGGAE